MWKTQRCFSLSIGEEVFTLISLPLSCNYYLGCVCVYLSIYLSNSHWCHKEYNRIPRHEMSDLYIKKKYWALVSGCPEQREGRLCVHADSVRQREWPYWYLSYLSLCSHRIKAPLEKGVSGEREQMVLLASDAKAPGASDVKRGQFAVTEFKLVERAGQSVRYTHTHTHMHTWGT